MNFIMNMSREEHARRLEHVLNLPLHRFLNLKILEHGPGFSTIELEPSPNSANAINVVHGGIIYSVLDFTAFVAMLPMMKDTQNAVTHDIHVSLLKPGPIDQPIIFKGSVRKMGRNIAFCDSEAYCGDSLIGIGRVTKSII